MKAASLVLISTLLTLTFTCGQSLENITSITFTKQTRGYLDEVVINRDSVHGLLENHRAPQQFKHFAADVDQDDWRNLMVALQDVSLHDIDGLQSPTMNRAHDAAIHSSISISFENGASVTHSFDDENPHPDLQPLLAVIKGLRPGLSK
jgi:hypothetical protein